MTRSKGSRDLRPRKRRSDLGKKRNTYAKKKTKPRRNINGNYKPYNSNRKRGDPIHVGFYQRVPMSKEGLRNWNTKIRRKVNRFVYGQRLHFILETDEIDTKEKISDFVCEYLWEGFWEIRIPVTKKNKGHVSYCAFGSVRIKDSPEGLKCKVNTSFKRRSLKRLYWWRGE